MSIQSIQLVYAVSALPIAQSRVIDRPLFCRKSARKKCYSSVVQLRTKAMI